jgi:hypothetical protein
MPPSNRNASVVVPCAILIGHCGFDRSSVAARSQAEGYKREGSRVSARAVGETDGRQLRLKEAAS